MIDCTKYTGQLYSEETGYTSDTIMARSFEEAISAWEKDGYEVMSVTDEDGNEHRC